jgi:uncharacterized protein (DUF58 family)
MVFSFFSFRSRQGRESIALAIIVSTGTAVCCLISLQEPWPSFSLIIITTETPHGFVMNDDVMRQHLTTGERAGMRYALAAPRLAPLGMQGVASGRRAGSSLEFNEYREYQPGDDLRHLDWNAYARSDQLLVKLFREEINPHADIVVDGSRSMALEGTAKAQATLGLAGFFAAAAGNAGYSYKAWLAGEELHPVTNGTTTPGQWQGIEFTSRRNPAEALHRARAGWRPRGMRIFLSDLLWVRDPLATLGHLAERAAAVIVVQVLAEADANPPTRGNLRLIDSETERMKEVFVDAAAETRYRDTLARHQQLWHHACRQIGGIMTQLVAEKLVRDWELDELVAQEVLQVL